MVFLGGANSKEFYFDLSDWKIGKVNQLAVYYIFIPRGNYFKFQWDPKWVIKKLDMISKKDLKSLREEGILVVRSKL